MHRNMGTIVFSCAILLAVCIAPANSGRGGMGAAGGRGGFGGGGARGSSGTNMRVKM
jgi:hypothetical protein